MMQNQQDEAVKKWDWLRAQTAKTLEKQRSRRCLSQFFHSLIPARHRGRKGDHVFAVPMSERSRRDGITAFLFVIAHVQCVLGDRPIAAAGPGQVSEPANLVPLAQIDLQLVRRGGVLELPIRVPHRVRVAVQGPIGFETRCLAVRPNVDRNGLHLRSGSRGSADNERENQTAGNQGPCPSSRRPRL
jgi:hypothetical protein